MKFIELVSRRQSVRKYCNKAVEPEKIQLCLEAARLSPSACNSQPWKFVVATEPALVKELAIATYSPVINFNKFAGQAPVFVVVVIEKPKIISQVGSAVKDREFPLIDIGIAASQFCLQAAELGLGSCMIGWFDEKNVKTLLQIPATKRLGLMISLGYPPEGYPLRKKIRKEIGMISSFNSYNP
jgi:nitroreductase